MSNSTNKSIADHEAAATHHVDEGSHSEHKGPGRGVGPDAVDERKRKLEVEVKQKAEK